MNDEIRFEELKGEIFSSISVKRNDGDDVITFKTVDGKEYQMYHDQGCCESVTIDDICGDLDDLIGSEILQAEEASQNTDPEDVEIDEVYRDAFTWTFYKLATIKGCVTIRWYGESNGYYSERVSLVRVS